MRRLTVLLLLAACATPPAPPAGAYTPSGPVVVRSGDLEVHEDLLRAALARLPQEQRMQMPPEDQARMGADAVLLTEVLYRKALELELDEGPEGRARTALAVREALAAVALEHLIAERITDEAVQAAYDARKVQFNRPQAHVRQILLPDEATAQEVVAGIKAGTDAATIAAQRSLDKSSGERGGDLGWVVRSQLPGAVDEAVFSTEATGVLDPIALEERWVVVVVEERRSTIPLEDVRPFLENGLRKEAVEQEVGELRKGLDPQWVKPPASVIEGGAEAPR
ncbi:MAG: peptidyl-prolyl cis-trans isomerase [Alphaproteobacteria bacterium]|nr:peptidyl-prolyl cis-trans isomerase [Alphaproteobacteria bacterium]